jgi:hypothetical protein
MKTRLAMLVVVLMVVATAGAFAAAAKAPASGAATKPSAAATPAERGMESGKMAVSAKTESATVSSIDPATRMVTLKMPDGQTKSFKVSEEVKNLDQIKAGDTVKATVIDAVGVSLRKAGEQPSAKETKSITLSPSGERPIVSQTQELTGKVQSVDQANRMVAIQGPGGQVHEVQAGPRMNLSQVKPGDNITLRHTQAMALGLEKAQG